jgi:HNH endonuclease
LKHRDDFKRTQHRVIAVNTKQAMKFWVGVTDNRWFEYLSEHRPDEVNFWRPRATQTFRAIEPGAPFLFKLHSPKNYIVGGGFFVSHTVLPLSLAWETFKEKNGAPDFSSFQGSIARYREREGYHEPDPEIGCIVLTSPFFFPQSEWIVEPPDWSPNLVQGKIYDSNEPIGQSIWEQVTDRLADAGLGRSESSIEAAAAISEARYGAEYVTQARLGQGAFRVLVTDAYLRRCAITGERTLPVLQAAHIRPFAQSGPNRIENGLLLRSDLHTLFDQGLLTVTKDLCVEVSGRIREKYENGRDYYALRGRTLVVVPSREIERPSLEMIRWHNENVYVG